MRPSEEFVPEFVEYVPPALEPGGLYVSMEYRVTAHLCASGCGEKVVLPLHPGQWSLLFDGEHVTLDPSVGNADLSCRSHYFIVANRVVWDRPLSAADGARGRVRDRDAVAGHARRDGGLPTRGRLRRVLHRLLRRR